MEFIGGILAAWFLVLCFVGACGLFVFVFRAGWLLADKVHKEPKED